jgi:hypothetical protein
VQSKGFETQPIKLKVAASISLSPQDIELLASRKFQISEICRWYGVPSVMVNDNNGTSVWGSGISEIVQGFYKLTLRPLLEKTELSMQTHLLSEQDRRSMEIEFDFNALLTADQKTLIETLKSAVNGSLMKPNEARRLLNLEPVEAGDNLFLQGAMMPIDQLGVEPAPVPADNTEALRSIAWELREVKHSVEVAKVSAPVLLPAAPMPPVASQPINIKLDMGMDAMTKIAHDMQSTAVKTMDTLAKGFEDMQLNFPAPVVNVNVPESKMVPPTVNVYNEVPAPQVQVIDNHPKRAVQTVERGTDDEIVRTIINYEK